MIIGHHCHSWLGGSSGEDGGGVGLADTEVYIWYDGIGKQTKTNKRY